MYSQHLFVTWKGKYLQLNHIIWKKTVYIINKLLIVEQVNPKVLLSVSKYSYFSFHMTA